MARYDVTVGVTRYYRATLDEDALEGLGEGWEQANGWTPEEDTDWTETGEHYARVESFEEHGFVCSHCGEDREGESYTFEGAQVCEGCLLDLAKDDA